MARFFDGAARVRPDDVDTVAVRWTVENRAGLPVNGFSIVREIGGNQVQIAADLRLPGAVPVAAAGWTIDPGQLEQEWKARATAFGAPPPDFDQALALIPLLQFALPEPDEAGLQASLGDIAVLFFNEHERAPAMVARHWSRRAVVDIATIAAMRGSAVSADAHLYADVVRLYRRSALSRLLFYAMNFGTAKFLGLGLDDQPGADADALPEYLASATYRGTLETRRVKVRAADPHWPPAPNALTATSGRTAIGYPAFAPFFIGGTWRPTAPAGASSGLVDLAALAPQGPRDYPSACAQLTWTVAPPAQDDRDGQSLVSPSPVFWTIERSDFGAASAVLDQVPVGGGSRFRTCHNGERIPSKERSFNDDEAIPWGEPPMEGWYSYRVQGIDIFGIAGDYSPTADVRLRDIFAPDSPAPMVEAERFELPPAAGLPVTVGLDWTADNELTAPDAAVFHLVQHWTPELCVPVRVKSCHDILEADGTVGPINLLETDVVLTDPGRQPLADGVIAGFAGMTLHAVEGDFRIRERGAQSSSIRVERSAGAAPPVGTAGIVGTGPTVPTAVQEVPRAKAIAGMLVVDGMQPLAVRLVDPVSRADLGAPPGRLYSHLLKHRFGVEPSADGTQLLVTDPAIEGDETGAALLRDLLTIAEANAIAFLSGSPALVLPRHDVAVSLAPPQADFIEGSVRLAVSAADAVPYQRGPYGIGNEGKPITLVRVARVLRPPVLPAYFPRRLWAHDAARFDHGARVTISWPAFEVAKTYQLERAFETALGLARSADDAALLAYADSAAADRAFERVTERAFLPEWSDTLPGQAPSVLSTASVQSPPPAWSAIG